MVISISDAGIIRHDTSSYPMTNSSPVNKVSNVKAISDKEQSIVRDAEKKYVAENTPAYNIQISSLGKAALQSLEAFNKGLNKLGDTSDDNNIVSTSSFEAKDVYDNKSVDNAKADEKVNDISVIDNDNINLKTEPSVDIESTPSTSAVTPNNLSSYSETQMKDMIAKGQITQADMDNELDGRKTDSSDIQNNMNPIMQQALAAYNFQMSYQMNSVMMR